MQKQIKFVFSLVFRFLSMSLKIRRGRQIKRRTKTIIFEVIKKDVGEQNDCLVECLGHDRDDKKLSNSGEVSLSGPVRGIHIVFIFSFLFFIVAPYLSLSLSLSFTFVLF